MVNNELLKEFIELSNELTALAVRAHREEHNTVCSDKVTPICNYSMSVSMQNNKPAVVSFSFGSNSEHEYEGNAFPGVNDKFEVTHNGKLIDIDEQCVVPTKSVNIAIDICEKFEDFLSERNVTIPNSEREDNNEDCQACIYGSDWDELKGSVGRIIAKHDEEIADEISGIIKSLKSAAKILEGVEE